MRLTKGMPKISLKTYIGLSMQSPLPSSSFHFGPFLEPPFFFQLHARNEARLYL